MDKRKHKRFLLKPIDFAFGDEASMTNRYSYKDWSIEPFVIKEKELTTDDTQPNYKFRELKQHIKHKSYCYIVRIFTENKRHQVQLFGYWFGRYGQAEMIGTHLETDSIYEARAIAFNWYLSHINKRQQIKEGFLPEAEASTAPAAPKKIFYRAEPWSFSWVTRRAGAVFFALLAYVELAKADPITAAVLGGYGFGSVAIVVLAALGISFLRKKLGGGQATFEDVEDYEPEADTVTFKKTVNV